jgi:ABC-2 type transport system ATP-binding protein
MIEVADLHKSYGSLKAVDGVSFSVERGETFALLGPNGAGKTTTILMLTGALRPDRGTIHVAGQHDPTQVEVRRQLGFAPQALALYEQLTGFENLAFFARLYGLAGAALGQRVQQALELAGLVERKDDYVKNYSGGMKRRLNLACALVHEPSVVFLDEPTVGVDPQSRNYIFQTIEGLVAKGLTILYTTHYMEEAARLCRRIAIMDQGKILALDTLDGLVRQHGGQATVEVELTEVPGDPATLPGVLDGNRLTFTSDRPQEELARLIQSGLPITRFQVSQPTLENVFLNLTGRRLRDE